MVRPSNLRDLRNSGHVTLPVKEEMRRNLIRKLRAGETLFRGIVGYEDSVIPQLENAILSGQDMVLLGERGQAKTRIARSLVQLLDDEIAVLAGTELNDDPFQPISQAGRLIIAEQGDAAAIEWITRERRYGEKLATPDITIADLIGEVDPIKVAEGRYLSDELTIHYGLLPRTNRGIFCLNELPDLAERIQVGLLNIMEERDVQIRGYKVRLALDIFVVASANPEDYTNRGRIITPLKDRFGAQIRTHYPKTLAHEISIMESERTHFTDDVETLVPDFMKEIVAEITHLARRSPDISQRSGVSVRVTIANYENVLSNSLKRAIRTGEKQAVPRISDLGAIIASTSGKVELESFGSDSRDDRVLEKIVQGAIQNVWNRHFTVAEFQPLTAAFDGGLRVEVSDRMPAMSYVQQVSELPGLIGAVQSMGASGQPSTVASAVEFVLEGLHISRKLNKERIDGGVRYGG